jgi:hypothetical protein
MQANNLAPVDFAAFSTLIDKLNPEMGKRAREAWHQKELKNEFLRIVRAIDAGSDKEYHLRELREFLYQKAHKNPFFDVDAVTSNGNVLKYLGIKVSPEFEKLFAKYFADSQGLKIVLENLHHAIDKQSDEDIERLCHRVRASLNQHVADVTTDPEMTAHRVNWLVQSLTKIPDDYRAMLVFMEREKDPQAVVLLMKQNMPDIEFKKHPREKEVERSAKRRKGEKAAAPAGRLFNKASSATLIKKLLAALRDYDTMESQPLLLVLDSISGGKIPDLDAMKNFVVGFQGMQEGEVKEMIRDICFPNTSILERHAELTPYYANMLVNSIDRNQNKAAKKVVEVQQDNLPEL